MDNIERRHRRAARRSGGGNTALAGIMLLIIGGALLMRKFDDSLPPWLFTWPMIVIIVGVFIGLANRFRDLGWLIICGVGFFFLADDIWPQVDITDFIVPAVIIVIGLALIFRPPFFKTNWKRNEGDWIFSAGIGEKENKAAKASKEDVLDVAAVFGSVKKNLFSKTFKGGDMVSVFGGVEVDLTQADFEGKVKIESVQIFGGATLIIPPTWQVRSEAVAIFGGIEDKRKQVAQQTPDRILMLEGIVMFGGIEIKSY